MNRHYHPYISAFFTLIILSATLFINYHFIAPLAWATVITIVTWPLYEWWYQRFVTHEIIAALSLTLFIAILVVIPIFFVIKNIVMELHSLTDLLTEANKNGLPLPAWIHNMPKFSTNLTAYWQNYLGKPHGLKELMHNSHIELESVGDVIRRIGSQVLHRSVTLGFTLFCLFFFYKDGLSLAKQVDHIGEFCLGDRWYLYSENLPLALKATVYGSILVGLGVGILLGISFWVAGLPAPALLGLFTALFAMVPFGAPIILGILVLILFVSGKLVAALSIGIWGTLILFIADHFIRPTLIGGATQLPFLAVLFGILGGVETLGLIGLFVGPIIMVLFTTLWREPLLAYAEK